MNINATLLGELLAVFAIINVLLCFSLGKRKTDSPYLCGLIGFVSALLFPLGLIFLAVLVSKSNKPVIA
ncbi:hypothetical protein [Pseudoalteromonas tunicata]|uniref:Uncharacterized protein n=1 Tax=Pseudoalteromonas tunicata D2 TaxID=87626 RepID=A4C3B0_9GAMM|nr:hypothetical protein [Pseudoalteromonas tunicata]ATC96677.1 hypothetical protein PTUN_b0256 [Pseudoalteromonas tunicata]AXT32849.1 hypothetical protein D1819_18550 [Pseudoalteromonas tunicata]EAR30042.1 hypothetical protein PTD2_00696 [Pseudoalteromonas tunicata D2]